MTHPASIVVVVLWGCLSAAALADIAPIEYHGAGIFPVDAPGIRMLSAKVDITWGAPSTLAASFVLDNQTDQPSEVQLGFPVSAVYRGDETTRIGPDLKPTPVRFTMKFDNVPADPSKIREVGTPEKNIPTDTAWYRCAHTFPPGRTTVQVATTLPTTFVYALPYREKLDYLIQTGAAWAGTIGSEEVAVHFPGPIETGQIVEAKPAGYRAQDNTILWQLKDFKPKGGDHDISVQFLRPDILPTLDKLRLKVASNPADAKAVLALAKNLFALGRAKGNAPFPPDFMSQAEFDEAIGKIRGRQDRALFRSRYSQKADGLYHEMEERDWTPDRMAVLRMLSETDYIRPDSESLYVNEARKLTEGLLKARPRNAEAWNVYLANYYRFQFAGGSFYRLQVDQINEAYKYCPDDPCIRLWHERGKLGPDHVGGRFDLQNELNEELQHRLAQQGIFKTDYPVIKGYY